MAPRSPIRIRFLMQVADLDQHEVGVIEIDKPEHLGESMPAALRELADGIELVGAKDVHGKPLVKWTPGLQAIADQMAMPADEPRTMSIRQEPFTDKQDPTPS